MEVHRAWKRGLLAAGVRYRPPEQLRHTWASTLLSRNAPLLYAQQRARWMPQPSATQAQPAPETASVSARRNAS